MNKQLTFYILLICLIGSLVTCKSGKILAPKSQQTSKEVENAKSSIEAGNKEEQALPSDTTKNLKNLKEEKVYKNFVDSIENGFQIEPLREYGVYVNKVDSVPQILKEIFPDVYFFRGEQDNGRKTLYFYLAYYKNELYSRSSFNDFIRATIGFNSITCETLIRIYCVLNFYEATYQTRAIIADDRKINDVYYTYLATIYSPKSLQELAFSFHSNGSIFQIMDVTNKKNIIYNSFEYGNQY